MFVQANFVDIYLQGMCDRSMQSGTELARKIKLTEPRDICTRLKRYLYSAKCSWIIRYDTNVFSRGTKGY